jgi:hypothetical protein
MQKSGKLNPFPFTENVVKYSYKSRLIIVWIFEMQFTITLYLVAAAIAMPVAQEDSKADKSASSVSKYYYGGGGWGNGGGWNNGWRNGGGWNNGWGNGGGWNNGWRSGGWS